MDPDVMEWWGARGLVATALVAAACAESPDGAPGAADRVALAAEGDAIVLREVWQAPPASDGRSLHELELRGPDGEARPAPFDGPVAAAVRWGDRLAIVDAGRDLWAVEPDGRRERLDRAVVGRPAASDDGAALAWVSQPALLAAISVRSGDVTRAVAVGLAGAGLLRLTPDGAGLLFVGGEPGLFAGLHVVDLGARPPRRRCLANCELRTGEGQGLPEAFVPLPGRADDLAFDGDDVRWPAGDGEQVRRWRQP